VLSDEGRPSFFIESEEGQKILRDYGKEEYGVALYMDKEAIRDYDQ
jgi:hypothetical protein